MLLKLFFLFFLPFLLFFIYFIITPHDFLWHSHLFFPQALAGITPPPLWGAWENVKYRPLSGSALEQRII